MQCRPLEQIQISSVAAELLSGAHEYKTQAARKSLRLGCISPLLFL